VKCDQIQRNLLSKLISAGCS